MTTVEQTFDEYLSDAVKQDALARVEENAEPGFLDKATELVHEIASRQHTLTAEDVTRAALEFGLEWHEPRAIANALLRAKREGWIETTSEHVRCTRPERNGGFQRVWRSRLVMP